MILENVGTLHFTIRCQNPKEHDLNLHRHENLKSHTSLKSYHYIKFLQFQDLSKPTIQQLCCMSAKLGLSL